MNADIDLKTLWNNRSAERPDADKIYLSAQQAARKAKSKARLLAVTMGVMFLYMVFVWRYSGMEMQSSKIGLCLVLAALVILCIRKLQFISLLKKTDIAADNKQFLQQLLLIKKERDGKERSALAVYFVLLVAGMLLLLYEPVMRMSPTWRIVVYTLTAGWFLFAWFYLRKRGIAKQNAELDKLIAQLKSLNEA